MVWTVTFRQPTEARRLRLRSANGIEAGSAGTLLLSHVLYDWSSMPLQQSSKLDSVCSFSQWKNGSRVFHISRLSSSASFSWSRSLCLRTVLLSILAPDCLGKKSRSIFYSQLTIIWWRKGKQSLCFLRLNRLVTSSWCCSSSYSGTTGTPTMNESM